MRFRFCNFTKLGAGISSALLLLVSLLVLVGTPVSLAAARQDGAVDPTFKSGSGANGSIGTTLIQPDGKILIAGTFNVYGNSPRRSIARLNPDGTLDQTFNSPGYEPFIHALALQSDGKILLAGQFRNTPSSGALSVVRLNSDGTQDTSFNFAGSASASYEVRTVAVQSDGKILIGGIFRNAAGRFLNIMRLNANGGVDSTFTPGTGANISVYKILLQDDGKILIGGGFTQYNGIGRKGIARLNADGSLDTTFTSGLTETQIAVMDVRLQSDDKIVIGGDFTTYSGVSRNKIARLNSDGSLDTTFNPGTGPSGTVYVVVIDGNGKILIAGDFESYNGAVRKRIARLNTDGSLDTSFDPGGSADSDIGDIVLLQNSDKILIVGFFLTYNDQPRNRMALLNANGSADPDFNAGNTGANSYIQALAVQNDDKILIGGNFTNYGGVNFSRIGRLNSDGTPDLDFVKGAGANGRVHKIDLHSSGKILIGGLFGQYNNVVRNGLALLNPDGSLDNAFDPNPAGVIPSDGTQIKMQPDGKVIYAGRRFTETDKVFRLNVDGSLDTSFAIGNHVRVTALEIQSDGKILVGGTFSNYNGSTHKNITRLNSDGTVDSTFDPGSGTDGEINSFTVQPDNKILIGGSFDQYNGIARRKVARLNPDGGLDRDFNATGVNRQVWAIKVQADGKILLGGAFFISTFEGGTHNGIRRLNADGSADTTFDAGEGADGWVSSLDLQSNGKIIIGGLFESVNNYTRDYIARLENHADSSVTLVGTPNPAVFGESITFTATVTPITATGTVQFTFGDSTNVTSTITNGVATYVTNTLPVGITSVKATYSGDNLLNGSVSAVYSQVVGVACNPLVVTKSIDNGQATACGSLSYALVAASSGVTITFALSNANSITFTGSLTPTVGVGVAIDGGANGVILDGNNVSGDGLRLAGNNRLINLTIRNFAGRELIVTNIRGDNRFYKVRVEG